MCSVGYLSQPPCSKCIVKGFGYAEGECGNYLTTGLHWVMII